MTMSDNNEKLGVGGTLFAAFLVVSVVVAAPVIGAAWLVSKGLEAVGIDLGSGGEFDPYLDDNMR